MKHNHYKVLKSKILATMIIVPAIFFMMALFIGYYYFTSSLASSTINRIVRIASDHKTMIQMFLDERKTDLAFVADCFDFSQLSHPKALPQVLSLLKRKSPAFVDLGLFTQDGTHVAYEGPYRLTGKNYHESEWFKVALKSDYYISDVFLGFRRIPHFIIAITQKTKDKIWVLRATIDTQYFNELVRKVRIGRTGEAYIINKMGIFQTHRRSGGDLLDKDKQDLKLLTPHKGTKSFITQDNNETEFIYATNWLNNDKWLLVVRQEKEDAFKVLHTATSLVIVISLLGGAIIVFLAFYMTNRVIKEMERAEAEKNKLNQQLIVAGRLAEIGEMSAGFAHEINNPLQIIRAEHKLIETIIAELTDKGEMPQNDDMKEVLDSIEQIRVQVDRCGEITQSVLKFARKTEPKTSQLQICSFVKQTSAMLAKKAAVNGIDLGLDLCNDACFVKADLGQLQQVLVNLLNNAFDAVLEKEPSPESKIVNISVKKEGNLAKISVSDNGNGVSQESLEHIFTPFFTTKPVGKGTGLGLPVCYGIVEKMGGTIEVQSQEGVGATFTIRLPLVEENSS